MTNFEFTKNNLDKASKYLAQYPERKKKSAILALLDLAQRQNDNYISKEVIKYIANLLEIAEIRVYEVISFYTMFNLTKPGENLIQICRTTSCWLRGSDKISEICEEKLGVNMGETTKDGKFTVKEVECLGACINAPIVQINDDYYENLDEISMNFIIENLQNNNKSAIKKYRDKNSLNEVNEPNA